MVGCSHPVTGTGLKPEYPPVGGGPVFTDVDSLQPIFRWQSFPRQEDLKADHEGVLSRVTAVTYDLNILGKKGYGPGELIYSRTGLPEPAHMVETPLEPSTRYFWTVRARFTLNGHLRVTEWGEQAGSYYRFETPSE